MRLLWHSVAPWAPTGYGQQTAEFVPRISAMGHDVAISAYYGLQGSELMWKGIRCLPSYNAAYGTDVLLPHALHHFGGEDDDSLAEASCRGMVITLGDVWTFTVPLIEQLAVASWVPVDHLGVPGVVAEWFAGTGAIPIAMSRFGEQALRDVGLASYYVPHGIDLSVFKPGDQAEAREATGIDPDAFVIGMVANNVGRDGNRKAFAEQIAAFAELHRQHSDTHFMLHTDVDSPAGMQLRPFLQKMLPKGSYSFSDVYSYRKGLSPKAVAQIYRAMDVLTNCSYGEGFGVPILEAQACGRPVVVTDATAMSELAQHGWRVGYERMWHDSQRGWAAKPLIADIVDAYLDAYDKGRDEGKRADAWAFAQDYDADLVADTYWRPLLEKFEEGLAKRTADVVARVHTAPKGLTSESIRQSDGYYWIDRGENTDDWVAWQDHEHWVRPILDDLLPTGGVLLDVGAHVGRWSIRFASKASHVIAVEANPTTAATLDRHLAMNDIHNVHVVRVAAWDEDTTLNIQDPNGRQDGGGARTLNADETDMDAPATKVLALPLDQSEVDILLRRYSRCDVVKLDVEGADLHALRGMRNILATYKPTLLIECHDIYGYYERADLEALLTDLGYTFEVAASIPSNWQPGVGIIDETRDGDYLLARPARVPATAS